MVVPNGVALVRSRSEPTLKTLQGTATSPPAHAHQPRDKYRQRLQNTLSYYQGIRNHDELIQKKVQENCQKLRATESEYWSNIQRMKSQVTARWKMPDDAYVGKQTAEEEIKEKAAKAQKSMAETAANYKNWVKEMEQRREAQLAANMVERRKELRELAAKKGQADMARKKALLEEQEKQCKAAGMYWTWLYDTKDKINNREPIIPLRPVRGAKSVEEMTQAKKAEMEQEMSQRQKEYNEWIASIQKAKHKTPFMKCNSVEERDALIHEQARQGVAKLNQAAAEYKKWTKEMEEKHEQRKLEKLKEKQESDRQFEAQQAASKEAIRQKYAEAKRKRQDIAKESQKQLHDMYERVQERPLLVEQAYHIGAFVKPHNGGPTPRN